MNFYRKSISIHLLGEKVRARVQIFRQFNRHYLQRKFCRANKLFSTRLEFRRISMHSIKFQEKFPSSLSSTFFSPRFNGLSWKFSSILKQLLYSLMRCFCFHSKGHFFTLVEGHLFIITPFLSPRPFSLKTIRFYFRFVVWKRWGNCLFCHSFEICCSARNFLRVQHLFIQSICKLVTFSSRSSPCQVDSSPRPLPLLNKLYN